MKYIGTKIDPTLHKQFTMTVVGKGTTKAQVLREAIKKFIEENQEEE